MGARLQVESVLVQISAMSHYSTLESIAMSLGHPWIIYRPNSLELHLILLSQYFSCSLAQQPHPVSRMSKMAENSTAATVPVSNDDSSRNVSSNNYLRGKQTPSRDVDQD